MKKYRRLSVALVATCLTVGMVAAPSALAGEGGSKAKAVTSQKAKAAGSSGLPRTTSQRLRRRIVRTEESLRGTRKAIETLLALSRGNRDGLAFLSAAAPQLINGLVALRDGTLQLKTILETQVQPALIRLRDEVGPGLIKLGDFIAAPEYGIGQVIVLEPGPTPNPQEGSFVETPDLPDTVQQAQTTQQFLAQQAGNLAVAYGVRSGENDGTGAANPAAVCKVTVTNEAGATETTAPNGALGGLPFQPVNTKSALTSTTPANAGFPFGLKTNNSAGDADVTTTFVSAVPVAAGDTYTVGLACVDTSPDAADPKA